MPQPLQLTSPEIRETSNPITTSTSHFNPSAHGFLSPTVVHLKEKKLKYKRLARKFKETVARREQELTDMIVDNKELKDALEKVKKDKREETDKMRGEIANLLDENHRY
jgi:hypothetical protein